MKSILKCMFALVCSLLSIQPLFASSYYPVKEINRPFALPALTWEPHANIYLDFLNYKGGSNQFAIQVGTGYGVVDNLEIGASFPLLFAPEFKAGDMTFYGLYDVSDLINVDTLKLAPRVRMVIPCSDYYSYWGYSSNFVMMADSSLKVKFHDMVAFLGDFGVGFSLSEYDDAFLLFIDFGLLVQPIEPLALNVGFGIDSYIMDDSHVLIPLRVRGQYTLIDDLDLFAEFAFLDLNDMGADWIQLVIGAAFRIGM